MKLQLGAKITFIKKMVGKEPERDTPHLKTKPETINSDKQIIQTVQNLKDELEEKVNEVLLTDSQWKIEKIHYFFIECVSIRVSRGASYIPTPAPYNNAKCGLINIKNESDDECFKWCLKYHQTKQEKNDDRVSVLKKVVDKYNYDNVNFPASYEDVETFEEKRRKISSIV
jgi:hypothetical protein